MTREEIFENRREVVKKICKQIRENDGRLINSKFFIERPYCDGEKNYKFSMANNLRLMVSDNKIICECDPRWISADEISKDEIISFQDCVNAVKKYAAEKGADELTAIFAVQIFIAESKLHTKIENYLPIYSDQILSDIEENPDKLFESAGKARAIFKILRQEKIKPLADEIASGKYFTDLKIIYHGSEIELKNKLGSIYPPETIMTGDAAYEFLFSLKSAERQKIWLEFFYREYAHGFFEKSVGKKSARHFEYFAGVEKIPT